MGLKVMDARDFARRYPMLDEWKLQREGVLKICPGILSPEGYQFDDEEVDAIAAEEMLREEPSMQQRIEESVGHSLGQFIGTKMTDSCRQMMAATVVKSLQRFGEVKRWTLEEVNKDEPCVRAEMVATDGRHFQFDVRLKLNG